MDKVETGAFNFLDKVETGAFNFLVKVIFHSFVKQFKFSDISMVYFQITDF